MIKQHDCKFLKLNFLESSLTWHALTFPYAFQFDSQVKCSLHQDVEHDNKLLVTCLRLVLNFSNCFHIASLHIGYFFLHLTTTFVHFSNTSSILSICLVTNSKLLSPIFYFLFFSQLVRIKKKNELLVQHPRENSHFSP